MLTVDKVATSLGIIEQLIRREFVSAEFFSDGSGHIVDDSAEIVIQWDELGSLEDKITQFISKRS